MSSPSIPLLEAAPTLAEPAPASVLRKRPFSVAANNCRGFFGFTAKALNLASGSPEFAALQVPPPFVVRKRP